MVDAAIQLMHHDDPIDTRGGQLVYIERVAGVAMLERDGKVENCHEAALVGSHGTTKGDNYLRHDLVPSNHDINTFIFLIIIHVDVIIFVVQVFLPMNMANTHWFLVVVNPRRREIQILDSLFSFVVRTQVIHVVRF